MDNVLNEEQRVKENLLDEVVEIITHRLTSWPVTHAVAVERLCGAMISYDGAK